MLRLGIRQEPRWIDLGHGVRLLVKPATTALITTARARARRQLEELRKAGEAARESGLPFEGPDLTDQDAATGYAFALSCMTLARELVLDWEGVGDEAGQPLPFALDGLGELLGYTGLAEAFFLAVSAGPDALSAEGNGSKPGPSGTGGVAPPIVRAARRARAAGAARMKKTPRTG